MKKFLPVLAVIALALPFGASADTACTIHTDAVTHQEYRYQEQIDIDPRGGFENWQYIGQKTDWTTDTEVDGHAIDEEFSVGKFIKVTHRWHQTDERTVIDEEAKDEPCADNGSGSSASSFGGGGGYTYCDLHDGFAVGPQHQCLDRATGKPVQTLSYRGTPVFGGIDTTAEQKKILLTQLVQVLQQMIFVLSR
jgi:hypothetical protein